MVDAKHYPLEDRDNIVWFNQMMDEQAALYCHQATSALQETTDAHLIWNCDAID